MFGWLFGKKKNDENQETVVEIQQTDLSLVSTNPIDTYVPFEPEIDWNERNLKRNEQRLFRLRQTYAELKAKGLEDSPRAQQFRKEILRRENSF